MTKQSQSQWVIEKLKEHGKITRNQCLSRYPAITRLSAIIQDLEQVGYTFNSYKDEKDWVYSLNTSPTKTIKVVDNDSLPPIKVNGRWVPQTVYKEEVVPV